LYSLKFYENVLNYLLWFKKFNGLRENESAMFLVVPLKDGFAQKHGWFFGIW